MTRIPVKARPMTDKDVAKVKPGDTRVYVPTGPQFPAGAAGTVELIDRPRTGDYLHVQVRYSPGRGQLLITETLPFAPGDLLTTLPAPRKAPAKKAAARKRSARKTPAKRAAARKTTARKTTARTPARPDPADARVTFERVGGAWTATSSRRGAKPVPVTYEQVTAVCVLLGLPKPPALRGTR